jgi:type II secretory ATPase GspE/PulE/Tfp pilus assembly ATPase PilB-like protein
MHTPALDDPMHRRESMANGVPLHQSEAAAPRAGPQSLQAELDALAATGPERTSRIVDLILADAVRRAASDVHLEPSHRAVEIRYRLDGVMQPAAMLSRELAPNLVARLKVLAELLTYRVDIPQEGSIRQAASRFGTDLRVSTFPTIHGERVVVRIFESTEEALDLNQLGLAPELRTGLVDLLREREGAILLTGPSGSGKTTTIYACLRYLVRTQGWGRHIVTIEDPVERVIEGISQSQVRPGTEFDFARGLRSLLRQDPEVIMIGEVRDRETAETAIQAALTGHLVFSTLHAGSACGVVSRLLDMGIEPYLLTSALKGVLNQRLLRRLCEACRCENGSEWVAPGCERCTGTGYRGRVLVAELLRLEEALRRAILDRSDTRTLEAAAAQGARQSIGDAADQAVAAGLTSLHEVERVFGPRPNGPS